MPPLTYFKMAGVFNILCHSLEARNLTRKAKTEHLHNKSPTHFYESGMNPQEWEAASAPPWEWIWDLYKGVGDCLRRCSGFQVCRVTSCFETVTQQILGQPLWQYVSRGIGNNGEHKK